MFRLKSLLVAAALLAGSSMYMYEHSKNQETEKAVSAVAKPIEVILTRSYLCGMKDQEKKQAVDQTMEQVLSAYQGWQIVSIAPGKIELSREENDISPECKKDGYFGLSPQGVLTLFRGRPEENHVIQSFYQINTARMKAALPKEEWQQLKKGIKVNDLAEYNSVLSTYGEFQMDEVEAFGHDN